MSWDIVLFNLSKKIDSLEDINEDILVPTDFVNVFEQHFLEIVKSENHRRIIGKDFSIGYFVDDEPVTNTMMSLYGEAGLFEIIHLARRNNWQIFDTGLGAMLDLDLPENNGYDNFQNYLHQVLNR